jgi:predicted ArsR family transcriptional regulator
MARLRAHLATLPASYPVTSGRMARALGLRQAVATMYLQRLAAAGVLEACGQSPPHLDGGRPGTIYRVKEPTT